MRNRILETALMVATMPLDKGKHGGACNRGACNERPADWWNPHMAAYYCEGCAKKINESLAASKLKLCEHDHRLGLGEESAP
jgi:hypothetical protein